MEPNHTLTGVLALLIEDRQARPPRERRASLEAVLARAGLTSREIGRLTGQDPDAVDARLSAETAGPALWRTVQRQRAAMAGATEARPSTTWS